MGNVGAHTIRAELEGIPITTRWRDQLAARLEQASDPKRAVDEWAEEVVAQDDAFAGWHYRSAFHAAMAGQLMVRAVELEDDLGAPGTVSLARSRATREEGDAFLDMTFEEALQWFRAKKVMEVAQFDALRDRFREGGFTSRVVTSNALRERTKRALDRSLQGELTLRDFITQLRADEIRLGITPTSDHALRNIARTNVASAYGAGKHQAMADPDVAKLRPYFEYLTARDTRVRDTHRMLEGLIFEVNSEAGRLYFPPLGFQCRCAPKSLSSRQLGGRKVSGVIPGLMPDLGFQDPPAPLTA